MDKITRVLGANGSPVDFLSPSEMVDLQKQLEGDIRGIKIHADQIVGLSPDVVAILQAQSKEAIRDAAGIVPDEVMVQGDGALLPFFAVGCSEWLYG